MSSSGTCIQRVTLDGSESESVSSSPTTTSLATRIPYCNQPHKDANYESQRARLENSWHSSIRLEGLVLDIWGRQIDRGRSRTHSFGILRHGATS
mmetsp:Transcript_21274/g.32523  ORF Transcript_21274/g.32523 Transcript_21274/m.32523 type:complete len:95 (-) Transcript_21274:292-576(-)